MTLKFNKKFYTREAIEETLNDFSEICEGSVNENEEYLEVNLTEKEPVKNIKEEFANYVLGIMQNNNE